MPLDSFSIFSTKSTLALSSASSISFSPIKRPILHLISLGCSKNLVDSEVMLGRLGEYELSEDVSRADVIIINTCGFIEAAKQESIQTILRAARDRKSGALLVVSGCLGARYKDEIIKEMPEVDIVMGVGEYDKIDTFLVKKGFIKNNPLQCPINITPKENAKQSVFLANETHKRIISNSNIHAFIKISEGCNQQCSFCAIPSFKGKLQSRTIASILKEIEILSAKGFSDISFIAQDSSSYLLDVGVNDGLCVLIKAIDSQRLIKNARIHYLYPSSTSPKLIETMINSPIIQNYFDMPIQHIADSMLKKMRRGAGRKKLIELLNIMRSAPQSFLRSSVIIGHPGEGEEEFRQLLDFISEGIFDRLNIFAFSKEEGTSAYNMKNHIPTSIINQRINRLNSVLKTQQKKHYNALKGQNLNVIIEGKSSVSEFFYSARDVRWGLDIDGEILINDSLLDVLDIGFYEANITDVRDGLLLGRVLRAI